MNRILRLEFDWALHGQTAFHNPLADPSNVWSRADGNVIAGMPTHPV
jgi:hypothetical protein